MFILIYLLFITNIQCQTNTNINSLNTISSTCFKDISIYKSNSPYNIQKKDDLICIDHEKNINTEETQINPIIDSNTLSRSINTENSVSSSFGTAINLTVYQVGTSVFRYINSTNTATYYSLPIKVFNSPICSGTQPITYLNDFTSTCSQLVNEQTCNNALNMKKYNNFCLITNPSSLTSNNPTFTCCSGSGSTDWTLPTCSNALQTLNLQIFYSNPNGIVNCTVTVTGRNATSDDFVPQTFSVRFIKIGSTVSTTVNSGNPGYLPGSLIISGNLNGNSITRLSGLTILQALSNDRTCSNTSNKLIYFGQNVQSTCLSPPASSTTCWNADNLLKHFKLDNVASFYVASVGNPETTTNNWISIQFCTSEIGSTNAPICQSSTPNIIDSQCYTRVNIHIVYANIGSVTNSQPIIGAVTYYFQYDNSISISTTPLLLTQTVTFQDVSNSPATEGDLIPRPNVRLPGDFFYPFSLNHGRNLNVFSSIFYIFIFCSILF